MYSIVQSVRKLRAVPLGPALLLPEHRFNWYLSVRSLLGPVCGFPVCYRGEPCVGPLRLCVWNGFQKRGKIRSYAILFLCGRGFCFSFLKRICVMKEMGESFFGRNSSKCLVVLISSLWHFWQTGEREIKLCLEDNCFMLFALETGKSGRVPVLI